MPPAVYTRDSPEFKVRLLKYIFAIKDEYRDRQPDYVAFFEYVGRTFEYGGVPLLHRPDELSTFLDYEVQAWTKEADGTVKKRRKGHEEGSEYDTLMRAFAKTLDAITLDHWHWVVTQRGPNYRRFREVPEEYRSRVVRLVDQQGARIVKSGDASKAAEYAAKMSGDSKTERHDFEYNAAKLKRVVEAAMERAREVGKPDLADSVQLLYEESLQNMDLRILLEKTLTQKTNHQEISEFQEYVRAAKKKLKQQKADRAAAARLKKSESLQSPASSTQSDRAAKGRALSRTQPPKVVISKSEESEDVKMGDAPRVGPSRGASGRFNSHHATEDSGYGSEQTGDKAEDSSMKGTTPSDNGSAKRKATSTSSSHAAEQEDFEAGRRTSKRRKRADSDDSGSYHPSQDEGRPVKSTAKRTRKDVHERNSRDSSPLSEPDDIDIEQAKEAYVDEMVRRKSAEASRQAIEDQYGPVSPSIVDNRSEPAESWTSMPSPTMEPVRPVPPPPPPERRAEEQATAGAQSRGTQVNNVVEARAPAPQPEGFTTEEGSNAYKLITATIAEAIVPYFKHVETKLENLEKGQKSNTQESIPSPKELLDAVKALQNGSLQGNSSETTQLVSQLLKNAAEASIHAAEAARKAGEVARDVSQVLMHISANEDNEATPRTSQRGQRKRS